jgi:hypothetical protein
MLLPCWRVRRSEGEGVGEGGRPGRRGMGEGAAVVCGEGRRRELFRASLLIRLLCINFVAYTVQYNDGAGQYFTVKVTQEDPSRPMYHAVSLVNTNKKSTGTGWHAGSGRLAGRLHIHK